MLSGFDLLTVHLPSIIGSVRAPTPSPGRRLLRTPYFAEFLAYLLGMDSSLSIAAIEAVILPGKSSHCLSLVSIRLNSTFHNGCSVSPITVLDADTPNKLLYSNHHEHRRIRQLQVSIDPCFVFHSLPVLRYGTWTRCCYQLMYTYLAVDGIPPSILSRYYRRFS